MALGRRGQTFRASAPLLILLIGAVLVLYILFLPPAQREALLSGTGGTGGGGVISSGASTVIMDKYLGTLLPSSGNAVEHPVPSTTVFVATNTKELKEIDSLLIKRSAFSRQDAEVVFTADTSVSKNYLLTFNVEQANGPLFISLNGHAIYERVITKRSPEPISLPREYLQAENTLTFSSGSVGWNFWSSNTYALRHVLITADVTDYQGSTSEQHFTITPEEHQKMEKATLQFVPQCDPKKTGRLNVALNGNSLYNGFLDCGVLTSQDVAKELLNIGDNRISFTSSEGAYTIDRIKITSLLKQQEYPVLYFNLPPDMFEQANVFAGRVVITLRFSEGNSLKQGSIIVNGFQDTFSTKNYYYQATLDPNVLIPNANSIQIVPQNGALNIPEVKVEMIG